MSSGGTSRPSVARLNADAVGSHGLDFRSWYALSDWTMHNECIQGYEWEAYVALDTFLGDGTRDGLQDASPKVTES
jgi:hypothetical protein